MGAEIQSRTSDFDQYTNTQCHNVDSHVDSLGICKHGGGSTITLASGPTSLTDTADTNVVDISISKLALRVREDFQEKIPLLLGIAQIGKTHSPN